MIMIGDIFGVSQYLRNELTKKGLIILGETRDNWPKEAKNDQCLIGRWFPTHEPGAFGEAAKSGFVVKNCKGEIVFESHSSASHLGYYYDNNVRLAMEKAFKPISSMHYQFNLTLKPEIEYPLVETTSENEESIKKYLESNKLETIEGIYKSYQSDNLANYRIGIIKKNDMFKAIILESDLVQWKPGEVKAIFEQSSMRGIYSVKWYLANKTPYETFSSMDNEALLTIELKDPKTGEKRLDKFIKMFPATIGSGNFKKDNSKASGSGFFISEDGIIGTNAHVIENTTNIEITVSNEIGLFTYKAKVLLTDDKNDVALLKVDDDKFKGLSSIPYGFSEASDVGSTVFTIGYPLNDVMGSNYKVTDGIISSNSGIADDVRYYQITVPLQPGNSGGPLFNKSGNIIGITSSRLNSNSVGTKIENVNYAIKASYLLNLLTMLPNKVKPQTTSQVSTKELQDQVKILKNYVCLIRVY